MLLRKALVALVVIETESSASLLRLGGLPRRKCPYSTFSQWLSRIWFAFVDESEQYGNFHEIAALAAIQQPALVVFVGDHRQIPGGLSKGRAAAANRHKLLQRPLGLRVGFWSCRTSSGYLTAASKRETCELLGSVMPHLCEPSSRTFRHSEFLRCCGDQQDSENCGNKAAADIDLTKCRLSQRRASEIGIFCVGVNVVHTE